ncbi:MAG: molybdopterin-dependent oxidoreductase [Nitrospirales bacterium]|nr:molybdopterin-dependent oxidoreductase [Nitrospirales bacterium]
MSHSNSDSGLTRRHFIRTGLILGGLSALGSQFIHARNSASLDLPFERGSRPLVAFPQKRPLMVMTTRPPQLETPFHIFNDHIFTPNDAFFVRWHLPNIPTRVDIQKFRLTIRGQVDTPLSLSLENLKRDFQPFEIAAVCQCSGNSRGYFTPRVPGGQWGHGAMGNAIWTGVRLRDLLHKAGLNPQAIQIRFNGLDQPVANVTPDFRKSLTMKDALDENVLVAYAMNGEPLPLLNGFPLRLVVPGWYATYWVKMLNDVEVLNEPDRNYWTEHAYKLPDNPCYCVTPGETPVATVPMGRMTVRSFITNFEDGVSLPSGQSVTVKGIAFDQGFGIDRVLFSYDGGSNWQAAKLGKDHGDFSFRTWEARFIPLARNTYHLQSLAINRIGESQRFSARWNPSGYLRNVIETVQVKAVRK